jgi:ABC-type branched-subunit amino acid transport system ATPase component
MTDEERKEIVRPRITFDSITFSDGQTLKLADDEILVFVGPNNAGKSAALQQLEESISRTEPQTIIKATTQKFEGTIESFRTWLKKTLCQSATRAR